MHITYFLSKHKKWKKVCKQLINESKYKDKKFKILSTMSNHELVKKILKHFLLYFEEDVIKTNEKNSCIKLRAS